MVEVTLSQQAHADEEKEANAQAAHATQLSREVLGEPRASDS